MSANDPIEVLPGRPSGYTTVGDWVLLAPISDRAVRIYGLLRMHGGHQAWPSQRTLADMLGIKKTDAVASAVSELVDLGAVEVTTVANTNGRHNVYTVHQSPPPGYDQGPLDRTCFYSKRGGGTPKSGVTHSGGVPRNQGVPIPPKNGVEALQEEVKQEALNLSSEVADATPDQQPPRPDVDQLCVQLRDAMIANGCKPPTITQTWRKTARLLLDRDKRPLAEAVRVLAWCQGDEFWKANIQSLPTFRAQYDKLRLRWEQTRPVGDLSSPETIKKWLRGQWKLGHVTEIEERTKLRYTPPPLPDHVATIEQARDFHAEQIRLWITAHSGEITELLTNRTEQQEVAS